MSREVPGTLAGHFGSLLEILNQVTELHMEGPVYAAAAPRVWGCVVPPIASCNTPLDSV
jgi:hypothetical protein